MRKNGYRGNITPLASLRKEHNKNYAKLPKDILDFPSCVLDKKYNQFMKGGQPCWFSDQTRKNMLDYTVFVFSRIPFYVNQVGIL